MFEWANPLVASVLLVVGAAILFFFVMPGEQRIDLTGPGAPLDLRERMARALRAAGIFDQAPSLILIFLGCVTALVAILLTIALGFPWGLILAPVFVFTCTHLYLMHRQRQWIGRAHDELIPFFNRMATSIGGNMPAARAYTQAVMESTVLREVLEPSAAKLASGASFAPTLVETLPVLPLRMWSVFVRQIELYEEVGGDLGETIQSTVRQVNKMLQLQAEARADYAIQAKQQQLIILILISGFVGMVFFVPNGKEMFATLLTSLPGLVGLCTGLAVIAFGLWFLNKQLRDVERKLNF